MAFRHIIAQMHDILARLPVYAESAVNRLHFLAIGNQLVFRDDLRHLRLFVIHHLPVIFFPSLHPFRCVVAHLTVNIHIGDEQRRLRGIIICGDAARVKFRVRIDIDGKRHLGKAAVFRRLDARSLKATFRLIAYACVIMYGEREINRIAQLDLLRNLDLLEAADGVIVDALIRAVVNHQVCSVQHACAVAEAEPAIHHVRNLMLIKPVRLFAFQIHTVRSLLAFLYPVPIEITGRFAFSEGPALRLVAGQRV